VTEPVIDSSQPHVARMYDYYLGGKDNFAVDREAVVAVEAAMPEVKLLARENRAFLRRAVRYMIGQGIRQFVDIGAGLPTAGNTHEVARKAAPGCRVAYIDNDPIVLAHGRALLATDDLTTVVTADLRDPSSIFDNAEVTGLIDFSRPVGVLLIAMTHFLHDGERKQIMDELGSHLAPGSHLAATHVTVDTHTPEAVEGVEAVYRRTPSPIYFRTHAEIAKLFDGYELADPGLVTIDQWRPDAADPTPEATRWLYGAVARKP
jgi:O-methyltransferase involved in polyketide biosynthesis